MTQLTEQFGAKFNRNYASKNKNKEKKQPRNSVITPELN